MKIKKPHLITGANGFVGRFLCKEMLAKGWQVRGTIRSANDIASLPTGVEAFQIESIGPDTDWSNTLDSIDTIVHLAARAHVMNETEADPLAVYRQVNVEGTLTLARQAAAAGVRRFVFLSSIGVNGQATSGGLPFQADDTPAPEDAYGISKREAEDGLMALARESGMAVVVIRPPLVYGPGAKGNFAALCRWVARGLPLPFGAVRHNRRSFVGLDNLVDLIVTCLEHPAAANQVFLAGDGEDVSTAELLKRLAGAMGRPARLVPVPVWLLKSAAAMVGRRDMARRLCGSLQVDISKARNLLGWTPPLSLAEGLKAAVSAQSSERAV